MEVVLAVVALVAVAVAAALAVSRRNPPVAPPPADGVPFAQVVDAVQGLRTETARLAENVGGVGERVALLEQHQAELRTGLVRLDAGLTKTTTLTSGIREATETIRGDLAQARASLTGLQSGAEARHSLEQQTARSIQRLEQVLAGTAAKGAAGENLLDVVFSRLPVEWQVRDFRVGNRTCEFGLRLPNGLVLPIDSKWPATHLIEQFLAAEDPAEQQRLKAQVESCVLDKAREVKKYLDPALTLNMGVAVVPDAVFDLCAGVQGQCMAESVVVVAHSMFVPYLLLVFQTVLRTSRDIDLEKLAAHLEQAEASLRGLQEEVEGRMSRAITMLGNSRDDLRRDIGRASSGLAAIQVHAAVADAERAIELIGE